MATSTFVAAALDAGYDLETLEQMLESRAHALQMDAEKGSSPSATTTLVSAATESTTQPSAAPPSAAPPRTQVVDENDLRNFLVARQQADTERDALDRRSQVALAQLHEVAQQALATRGHAVDRYGEELLEHAQEKGLAVLEQSPHVQQIVQRRIDECARALTVEHTREIVKMQHTVDRRLHEVDGLLRDLHERSARADALATEASAALAAMEERAAAKQWTTSIGSPESRGGGYGASPSRDWGTPSTPGTPRVRGEPTGGRGEGPSTLRAARTTQHSSEVDLYGAAASPPPLRSASDGRTLGGVVQRRSETLPRDHAPPQSAQSRKSSIETASAAVAHGDICEEMRRPTARRSSIARDAARQATSATGVHAERVAVPQRRGSRSGPRGRNPPSTWSHTERVTQRGAPPLDGGPGSSYSFIYRYILNESC